MALFRGIQEYIALGANNITLVFDSGNIVNISGNIFLYPPQGHPILYNSHNKIRIRKGFENVWRELSLMDRDGKKQCLSFLNYC